jgi:radical SAM protein with 4Fe4S-binding SPASM domain
VASPSIPEITLGDLMAEMDAEARRIPLQGTIEPTFRCNLGCVHCYVNEPAGAAEVRDRELGTERVKALVDEIADAGCLSLLLTGGEVLVRRDFPEIYLHALARGLRVTVFTNGTMVTDEIADLFDRHRPVSVEITLYGMTAETYDRVTRVPGSFARCREGIDRLLARGVRLKLKTMALTWNAHEIPAMREFARARGCDFQHDGILNRRVDCGASRNGELQLTPAQVVALDLDDAEQARILKEACDEALAAAAAPAAGPADDHVYSCGAGRNTFTVDPYGSLQLCQLSRRNGFDLRAGTFDEGWNEHFPRLRARTWQSNDVCRRCSLISLCSSCAGAAELEHGDPEAIVAHSCEVTHRRAHAFASTVPGHRADASCCLGAAVAAAAEVPSTPSPAPAGAGGGGPGSGCGCASSGREAAAPLIQIGRRPA